MTEPKYNVGDYVEVYYGQYEGHNFRIKNRRWVDGYWVGNYYAEPSWMYLYDGMLIGCWMFENQLVRA